MPQAERTLGQPFKYLIALVGLLAVCATICYVVSRTHPKPQPRPPEKNFSLLKKDLIEAQTKLNIPFATKSGRPTGFAKEFLATLSTLELDWESHTPSPGTRAQAYMTTIREGCSPIRTAYLEVLRDAPQAVPYTEVMRLKACIDLSTETNVFYLLLQTLQEEEAESRK